MFKNWSVKAGLAVMVLAAILRLYQLGAVPHGMTWDEAAIGYNGHAVLVARRDEWLAKAPLSFKSFGDYKSPLAIYINGAVTGVLGMKLWAVRLPFAVSGIMAVGLMMLLTRRVIDDENTTPFSQFITLLKPWFIVAIGFMMATTPWHIHYSRVGFESGMALTFLMTGLWLLHEVRSWPESRAFRQVSGRVVQRSLSMAAAFSLVCSMYTYHSAKVVTPVLAILTVMLWWPEFKRHLKSLWFFLVSAMVLITPLAADTVWGSSGERFNQATVFSRGLDIPTLISTLAQHTAAHFNPSYLISGYTPTLLHGDGAWGVFLVTTFGLVVAGLVATVQQTREVVQGKSTWRTLRLPVMAVAWIGLGTLPAVVGVDVPHSNRALLSLPGYLLLAVWGLMWVAEVIRSTSFNQKQLGSRGEKQTLLKIVMGMWVLLQSVLLIGYIRHYFTVYAQTSATEFRDGYLEAFEYIVPYEKGQNGIEPVKQVIFSSKYGKPYIYALFVRKTHPVYYQGGSLNNYLFVDKITQSHLDTPNVLVVATDEEVLPSDRAQKLIYGSDGQVKFKIYRTPNQ